MKIPDWMIAFGFTGLVTLLAGPVSAELNLEETSERLARGEYLVTGVADCAGCHSERDLDLYGYPPKKGRELAGGIIFRDLGEAAITPNITPYALAQWSDQQLFDAMTRGVRPDGRVLHPDMPYAKYGTMDLEEIYSMMVYLRSLEPIVAGPYPSEFPGEHQAFEPRPGTLSRPGNQATDVEMGAYLVKVSGCNGCHDGTGVNAEGRNLEGLTLAGGREFPLAGRGLMRAANLTPDPTSGLGAWTREAFQARFKAMRGSEKQRVVTGQPNTVMHWWSYSYLPANDLGYIHAYLQSLPAVQNQVVRFEALPGEVISPNWSEQ
jgi:mono/diheme cytochrome c family protein